MTTLIRLPADPFRADVLRGEQVLGEVLELCPYCGGSGSWIGGDEQFECWCVRDRRDEEEGK